jgi:copper transport protein
MRARIVKGLGVGLAVAALAGMHLAAQGNPEAAKLKNPVASTPESLAMGKASYQRFCANCHGTDGKGGPGNDLVPPSPDLTGTDWKHGSTDGEIFNTIKNGVGPDFNMAAWGAQGFSDEDIWNVVNYVRSLAKK